MKNDRSRIEGAVHAGTSRGSRRVNGVATTVETPAPASTPANDSDADYNTPGANKAVGANGTVVAEVDRETGQSLDDTSGSEETISCTISDGNGGTVTVPVAATVKGVTGRRRIAGGTDLATHAPSLIELTHVVFSPFDKHGSDTLKVQFEGLPSGSVVSHPEAIAKKDAELMALSGRITTLQFEIAATEQTRVEKHCDRQGLVDAGGPQEDIDMLSAELASLEDLIKLKAAQKSVAEIEREIARLEGQQLTQTAGTGGTASFHGPRSGYVLQLPDGNVDGCRP